MTSCLVAFEGIDNAGKTTQVDILGKQLKLHGVPCFISRELTTNLGRTITDYFKTPKFTPILKTLLFAADRAERYAFEIKPALESDMIVLTDRWVFSAVAYRSAEGLEEDYVFRVNSCVKLADFTVLIDIDPESAEYRARTSNKPCPYSLDFLKTVRTVYLNIANRFEIPVVNGYLQVEDITNIIIELISKKLGKSLW